MTDDSRTPVFPDIPTFAEALGGGDQFVYTAWFGVFVAAGTPKELVARINEAITEVINSPEIKDKLAKDGFQVIASKPEEFDKILKVETTTWRGVMDAFK